MDPHVGMSGSIRTSARADVPHSLSKPSSAAVSHPLVRRRPSSGGRLVVARADGAPPRALEIGPGCFIEADWGRSASS